MKGRTKTWLIIGLIVIIAIGFLIRLALSLFFGILNYGDQFKSSSKFAPISSSPTVYKKFVYFLAKDGNIYALDAINGKKKWQRTIYKPNILQSQLDIVSPAPVAGDKLVYVAHGKHMLAFDYQNGKKEWQKAASDDSPDGIEAYGYYDNVLYYYSDVLYAVDAKTGREKWELKPVNPQGWTDVATAGSFVVDRSNLYYLTNDGYIYAIDIQKRKVRWISQKIANEDSEKTNFILSNNLLYFGSNLGLNAINSRTGKFVWKVKLKGDITPLTPVAADKWVYFPASNGNLYAVDAKIGQTKWKSKLGSISEPLVSGDFIYFAGFDFKIHSLNLLKHKEDWQLDLDTKPGADFNKPTLANGLMYISSVLDGNLYAISIRNGKLKWSTRD